MREASNQCCADAPADRTNTKASAAASFMGPPEERRRETRADERARRARAARPPGAWRWRISWAATRACPLQEAKGAAEPVRVACRAGQAGHHTAVSTDP